VEKMACLKKIAVPSENDTVEVCIGRKEKEILELVGVYDFEGVKDIAQYLSHSLDYINVVYQTVWNMKDKKLVELSREGPKKGLRIKLTETGKKVLEELQKLEQNQNANKKDVKICAPYETC
jgi:molybdenum-dependent DNA-binding transcriptional regulator ModE